MPLTSQKAALGFILTVAAILLFTRLGSISLFQVAEARNAECAKEMYQENNWIVPLFNGQLRTDKPVMGYYAMIAAYHIFGVNEGSTRFFSAVCGFLTILITFLFTKRHFGKATAVWAMAALLSSLHTIVQFRLATPDPYLILFHVASLFCFWEGWKTSKWKWYAIMYVLMGLGILTKGPVGMLLPALTIILFLLLNKKLSWTSIKQLHPWYGVGLMLIICLPWYILVHIKTQGAWTSGFFYNHNFSRFSQTLDGHRGSFLLPTIFVLSGMFPFSVFSVRAIGFTWRQSKENDNLNFLLIAFFTVLVFYSFSQTKLFNYTTPCYPFLAILIAYWLKSLPQKISTTRFIPELIFITLISIALPVVVFFYTKNTEPLKQIGWIAFTFAALPAASIYTLVSLRKNLRRYLIFIVSAYVLTIFLLLTIALPAVDQQTAFRKRQNILNEHKIIVAYKNFNDAFVFYTHSSIPVFNSEAALDSFLLHHTNVLVLNKNKHINELNNKPDLEIISRDKDLFSSSYSTIYLKK